MIICPNCGNIAEYDSYYDRTYCLNNNCGWSKRGKEELNMDEYKIYKDGDMWCCVDGNFENLQESNSGWGCTPQEALENFIGISQISKDLDKLSKEMHNEHI